MTPPSWPPHWGFILASYGLTCLAVLLILGGSLIRLYRAKRRLALMHRLYKPSSSLD
ncbi:MULTISPECIES: heme exporter protein CcmD [Bombella]|uniref:Heme exporter protein CcmD n=2 Tax=Bombella TaxID=1654741 RepID=A0ABT3WLK7_9PROT|nr:MULTISPECIES: heme exporter protein CcmD [Bombella]MCX5613734.1 heme exporter protein CcmD [Bombella saccharophila]MCX5619563.1 heme exporter protein CcmD [Bombella pollinis]